MAVTAAVVAVAGTGYSIVQGNKAAATQRESNRVANATQKIQDRNLLKQKQREQAIRAAQIRQAASSTGVAESTGEIGALGGLSTIYSGMVAQMQGQQAAADGMTALNNKSATQMNRARTGQGLANLSLSVYSAFS